MTILRLPSQDKPVAACDQLASQCQTNNAPPGVVDLDAYRRGCALLDVAALEHPDTRAPDAAELAQLAELPPSCPVAHAFRVERNRDPQAKAAEKEHGGAWFIVGVDCPLCGLQHGHGARRAHGATVTHTHRSAHCKSKRGAYHVRIDWRAVVHAKPGELWEKVRRKPREGFTPWTPAVGSEL
jgi:hypothetical protein